MSACESKGVWQEGLTSWKRLRQETKGLTDYERPGIHTVDGSEILHQLIW